MKIKNIFSFFFFAITTQVNSGNLVLPEKPIEHTYFSNETHDLKIYQLSKVKNLTNQPAMIVFHGGGWAMGEASWGFGSAVEFAELGIVAFSAQYRLKDDKTITPVESVEDAKNAICWLRKNAKNLGIDPNKIGVYGWSTGAHIGAMVAAKKLKSEEGLSCVPNLLAMRSPALDLKGNDYFESILLGKATPEAYSPARNIHDQMPPSIIVIGKADTVTPLSGAQLYHDKMKAFKRVSELHVFEGVGHLFTPSSEPDTSWPNPDKTVSEKATKAVRQFLNNHGWAQ